MPRFRTFYTKNLDFSTKTNKPWKCKLMKCFVPVVAMSFLATLDSNTWQVSRREMKFVMISGQGLENQASEIIKWTNTLVKFPVVSGILDICDKSEIFRLKVKRNRTRRRLGAWVSMTRQVTCYVEQNIATNTLTWSPLCAHYWFRLKSELP